VTRFLAASLVAMASLAAGADDGPKKNTVPARTPADAELAYAGPDWQVWTEHTHLPDNGDRAGPATRTRYYLQKPLGKTAILVSDQVGWGRLEVGTVLPDGSVMLTARGAYYWCEPDGSSVGDRPAGGFGGPRLTSTMIEVPGTNLHYAILAVGPTGALVQPYDLNEVRPVYYTPLVGRKIDAGARVELATAHVNSHPPFLLRGDWVAWDDSAYNVKTKKRWRFPLEGDANHHWPVALDGRLAVYEDARVGSTWRTFDLDTGRELSARESTRALEYFVAVRDGVGYIVRDRGRTAGEKEWHELVAVDLSAGEGAEKVVFRGPRLLGSSSGGAPCSWQSRRFFESADGLVVWGGEEWVTIGWGAGLPRE
jgi:hypothetical protein